jgi:hypothetical protein
MPGAPLTFSFQLLTQADLKDPQLGNLNNQLRQFFLAIQSRYGTIGPVQMFGDIDMQGHVLLNVGPTMHTVSLKKKVIAPAARPNLDAAKPLTAAPSTSPPAPVSTLTVPPLVKVVDLDGRHAQISVGPGVKFGVAYSRRIDTVAKSATADEYDYYVDPKTGILTMSKGAFADASNLIATVRTKIADAA